MTKGLAVYWRAFPPFSYDPRRGQSMAERLPLQGTRHRTPEGTARDRLASWPTLPELARPGSR